MAWWTQDQDYRCKERNQQEAERSTDSVDYQRGVQRQELPPDRVNSHLSENLQVVEKDGLFADLVKLNDVLARPD